jgi:hypothetical protein
MVALSAKEKWLVDAGVSFIQPPQRQEWARWPALTPLESQLLSARAVQIPISIAEIALSALSALADHIKRDLDNPVISEDDEDALFNDLEATQNAVIFFARELGHIPRA